MDSCASARSSILLHSTLYASFLAPVRFQECSEAIGRRRKELEAFEGDLGEERLISSTFWNFQTFQARMHAFEGLPDHMCLHACVFICTAGFDERERRGRVDLLRGGKKCHIRDSRVPLSPTGG